MSLVTTDAKPTVDLSPIFILSRKQTDGAIGQCNSLDNTSCTAAIHLADVTTVSLDNLMIDRSNQMGINGLNVSDLTLSDSVVSHAGNGENEAVLQLI